MNTNGFIVWENSTSVCIATGFSRRGKNRKTGDMIQLWFLPREVNPVQAALTGQDHVVCFGCPLRPASGGKCYVNLGQAPLAVWRAWKAGNYAVMPSAEIFRGRAVRFGAYGDPTLLPLALVQEITAVCNGWTGYTHRWANGLTVGYRRFFVASADSPEEQIQATSAGWRTFRVAPRNSTWKFSDEIGCPAAKENGGRVKCIDCQLCRGSAIKAKSIVIQQH